MKNDKIKQNNDNEKNMKKFLTPKNLIAVLLISCLGYYLFILITAKKEMLGLKPDEKVFATVIDPLQKGSEQYCTGIYTTPEATWLVGKYEESDYFKSDKPETSFDLTSLAPPKGENYGSLLFGLRDRKVVTLISKLNSEGQFEEVARLDDIGCLYTIPNTQTVVLLTGLDSQKEAESHITEDGEYIFNSPQTLVFRSDDLGGQWHIQKEGFFEKIDSQAWTIRPIFYDNNIWVLKDDDSEIPVEGLPKEKESGLYLSTDTGKSYIPIITTETVYIHKDKIIHEAPKDANFNESPQYGIYNLHFRQYDKNSAILLATQQFRFESTKGNHVENIYNLTTQIHLNKVNDKWTMTSLKRIKDLVIENIESNKNGKIITVQYLRNHNKSVIAELNPKNLTWKINGDIPTVFSPFNDYPSADYIWMNDKIILMSTRHHHRVPRLILPSKWFNYSDPASASGFGVFYSKDWGQNWKKLKIRGYLSVYGMNNSNNQIFWSKSHYTNNDLEIFSHEIK